MPLGMAKQPSWQTHRLIQRRQQRPTEPQQPLGHRRSVRKIQMLTRAFKCHPGLDPGSIKPVGAEAPTYSSDLQLRPTAATYSCDLQKLRGSKAVEIQYPQAAVFDADELTRFQDFQGFVHPLPRQAHQIGQLLLRDAQHFTHA